MASAGRRHVVPRSTARSRPAAKKKAVTLKSSVAEAIGGRRQAQSLKEVRVALRRHPIGVDDFVLEVARATPLELVEIERHGVAGNVVKGLAKRLEIPAVRVFDMLGVPKATVEKKASTGDVVSGSGGQAAIGMARLIGIAQEIVANSTAKGAKGFDAAKWLGQWLERPQASLGGRKPAELIDTPTGVDVVARLLGAIESGAYQ